MHTEQWIYTTQNSFHRRRTWESLWTKISNRINHIHKYRFAGLVFTMPFDWTSIETNENRRHLALWTIRPENPDYFWQTHLTKPTNKWVSSLRDSRSARLQKQCWLKRKRKSWNVKKCSSNCSKLSRYQWAWGYFQRRMAPSALTLTTYLLPGQIFKRVMLPLCPIPTQVTSPSL